MIHTIILAKKKFNCFILRKFSKRTHCPCIVTLALLLFVLLLLSAPTRDSVSSVYVIFFSFEIQSFFKSLSLQDRGLFKNYIIAFCLFFDPPSQYFVDNFIKTGLNKLRKCSTYRESFFFCIPMKVMK